MLHTVRHPVCELLSTHIIMLTELERSAFHKTLVTFEASRSCKYIANYSRVR